MKVYVATDPPDPVDAATTAALLAVDALVIASAAPAGGSVVAAATKSAKATAATTTTVKTAARNTSRKLLGQRAQDAQVELVKQMFLMDSYSMAALSSDVEAAKLDAERRTNAMTPAAAGGADG